MSSRKLDSPYKISIVGNFNVGKSSVINRCLFNRFSEITESTIGSAFYSIQSYDLSPISSTTSASSATSAIAEKDQKDKAIKVHIWDTAGQERYMSLIPMYVRGSDAVIIVYDVTASDSLYSVKSFIKNINSYIEEPIIYIVGNKIDLFKDIHIVKLEVELLARELSMPHYDVSAKDGTNCDQLLQPIIESIYNARKTTFQDSQDNFDNQQNTVNLSGAGSGSYSFLNCCGGT